MILGVDGCVNCPMYQYSVDEQFKLRSMCLHPLSTKQVISRAYEKERGVIPITPQDCPLNQESLTLKR